MEGLAVEGYAMGMPDDAIDEWLSLGMRLSERNKRR